MLATLLTPLSPWAGASFRPRACLPKLAHGIEGEGTEDELLYGPGGMDAAILAAIGKPVGEEDGGQAPATKAEEFGLSADELSPEELERLRAESQRRAALATEAMGGAFPPAMAAMMPTNPFARPGGFFEPYAEQELADLWSMHTSLFGEDAADEPADDA